MGLHETVSLSIYLIKRNIHRVVVLMVAWCVCIDVSLAEVFVVQSTTDAPQAVQTSYTLKYPQNVTTGNLLIG